MGNLNDQNFKREGIDLRRLPARWKAAGLVILAGGTLTLLLLWANSAALFGLRIPGVYLIYAMLAWQFAFIVLGIAVLARHVRQRQGSVGVGQVLLGMFIGFLLPMSMLWFD